MHALSEAIGKLVIFFEVIILGIQIASIFELIESNLFLVVEQAARISLASFRDHNIIPA